MNKYEVVPFQNKECGAVLVAVLLITLVLFALIFSVIQTTLLSRKLAKYYRDANLAFISAENNLLFLENEIAKGRLPKEADLISDAICGTKIFLITVKGKSGSITKTLQSTYAKIDPTIHCDETPKLQSGRQSWHELHEIE